MKQASFEPNTVSPRGTQPCSEGRPPGISPKPSLFPGGAAQLLSHRGGGCRALTGGEEEEEAAQALTGGGGGGRGPFTGKRAGAGARAWPAGEDSSRSQEMDDWLSGAHQGHLAFRDTPQTCGPGRWV